MSLKTLIDAHAQSIARHEVEIALANLLGVTRLDLHSKVIDEKLLTNELQENLTAIVNRRAKGEPLQYILGTAPFRYLELAVGPGVLIPRPETEGLVDLVLHHLAKLPDPISVIDAGSGSGAIAISLVQETLGKKDVRVVAVEPSADASKYLSENIAKYEFDIRVVNSNIESALPEVKADIFVANPPYIPAPLASSLPGELAFEPEMALYGGDTGLAVVEAFITAAARLLKPNGFFAMEHFEEQGPEIESLLTQEFRLISLHKDLAGRIRYTTATKK
jgi:release factor glutamine methyltransferase